MKLTKTDLKEMIREVLKEELALREADNAPAEVIDEKNMFPTMIRSISDEKPDGLGKLTVRGDNGFCIIPDNQNDIPWAVEGSYLKGRIYYFPLVSPKLKNPELSDELKAAYVKHVKNFWEKEASQSECTYKVELTDSLTIKITCTPKPGYAFNHDKLLKPNNLFAVPDKYFHERKETTESILYDWYMND
jgi:hypothetical protein